MEVARCDLCRCARLNSRFIDLSHKAQRDWILLTTVGPVESIRRMTLGDHLQYCPSAAAAAAAIEGCMQMQETYMVEANGLLYGYAHRRIYVRVITGQ